MQNTSNIKQKILEVLSTKGPALPVHIARETGMSMLFASAFLSELISEKKVKTSNMRVGGSPLYFIPGKEYALEKYGDYLKSKEKEAFLLLKEKKFLKDTNQEPAIRVALRSIKDFAFPFKHNEEIFWRYFKTPQNEFQTQIQPQKTPKPETKEKPKEQEIKKPESKQETKEETKEKPILEVKQLKKEKLKDKHEFSEKINNFMEYKDIELLEEISSKKREFIAKARINSDLGKIWILVIAKDKKSITENDIKLCLQKSNEENLIILLISPGKPNKKALESLKKYKGLIKYLELENV